MIKCYLNFFGLFLLNGLLTTMTKRHCGTISVRYSAEAAAGAPPHPVARSGESHLSLRTNQTVAEQVLEQFPGFQNMFQISRALSSKFLYSADSLSCMYCTFFPRLSIVLSIVLYNIVSLSLFIKK